MYRDYILALVREALQEPAGGTTFEHVRGEVTDIDTAGGCATIHVEGKGPIVANKAVLALGNFPPRHPPVDNRSALESERYIRNPWDPGVLDCLSRRDTVFLIGMGQTTVDLVVALHRRAHEGRIIALSRRGLLPLAHRGFDPYESFFEEIRELKTILDVFRIVRKHLDRAESMGIDKRAVIDSLRPDTQTIWLGLAQDEKRRFLRHVFRYWEIIRSRIPPESEAIIDAMRASGQLDVLAGRIRDLAESEAAMNVDYVPHGHTRHEVVTAAIVINCIGPESDYGRIDHPLVRNLMRRGLIRPGPANLGVDALLNGAIIGQNGAASDVLYTLGSSMKGVLWEVVAVPEIRVQAERLARQLLDSDHRRRDASSTHAR
ncbi:MAG: FAD/NAD(P)-binding protein [Solirubrobacterales bacterium]